MRCMCGGCGDCVGLDALEAQARAEAEAEADEVEELAMDEWLDFDSLCRSLGDAAPGSALEAGERAVRQIYGHHGLAMMGL